jgi:23S rRNA (uridine2552-2'-O)-methyltransferase
LIELVKRKKQVAGEKMARAKDSRKRNTQGRIKTHVKVKTAKGRKSSSTRWLQRQLNDPYVMEAQRLGYRSRAAFKLLDLDDKFQFLKPGSRVVDLGCAPGGWSQVAVERTGKKKGGYVVGLDLLEVDPVEGATLIQKDFNDDDAPEVLKGLMGGHQADAVISDMAANTTGHRATDHLRIMNLIELAYDFARQVLAPEGVFVAKVFQGGAEDAFLNGLKQDFKKVYHFKPQSSRSDSAEMYLVAVGFRA